MASCHCTRPLTTPVTYTSPSGPRLNFVGLGLAVSGPVMAGIDNGIGIGAAGAGAPCASAVVVPPANASAAVSMKPAKTRNFLVIGSVPSHLVSNKSAATWLTNRIAAHRMFAAQQRACHAG